MSPVTLGPFHLQNRIVMPPLTRNRASATFVPTPRMAIYYAQRASAGLVVAEGSPISPEAVAYPRVPGIWNDEQVTGWRAVTDAVHEAHGVIFQQLWHVGRVSHTLNQPGGRLPVAPSAVPVEGASIYTSEGLQPFETPRSLRTDEVGRVVSDYRMAAKRSHRAGFDGVEVHAANGYLIDQFLNSNTNLRDDAWGGDVPARVRFLGAVVDAVADVWGPDRVGVRLSPSGTFMDCRDDDRQGLYGEAVTALGQRRIAYLHLVEPTIAGSESVDAAPDSIPSSWFRSLYPGTVIVSGDHTFETGTRALRDGHADLIGYGRDFIANPDLPRRFALGAPLTVADRRTFYSGGDSGYTDYPFLKQS